MSAIRPLLATTLAAAALAVAAPGARAEPVKCQRTIVKHADKLAQAVAKALRACEERKRNGKLAPATVCLLEAKTAAKIAAAESALRAQLDKRCGGDDETCGTGDDDALAALGWPDACPDFEGLGCANPIASCAGVTECLRCVHRSAVVQAMALAYSDLVPADKKTAKPLFKCQTTLNGELLKYHARRSKALGKCWDLRLQGKHANACPAPGDGKAAAKIAQARSGFVAKVCKACGGADKACGGAADLAPAAILSLPACPAVGDCGGAIDTLADLAECFACVADFTSDCALALSVPAHASYPPACAAPVAFPTASPQPSATPTATVPGAPTPTPTPSATVPGATTATPTVTATASAVAPTATPSAGPSPAPCPVAGPGTVTTDATITLAASQAVGAAALLLGYLPDRVGLPAAGGGASVRARVSDLTAGELIDKGAPNNQDANADLISDRVRFSLVSTNGVAGTILAVRFDRCDGAPLTAAGDYACTLQNVVATDGVTPIAGASCAAAVAHGP